MNCASCSIIFEARNSWRVNRLIYRTYSWSKYLFFPTKKKKKEPSH